MITAGTRAMLGGIVRTPLTVVGVPSFVGGIKGVQSVPGKVRLSKEIRPLA